MQASLSNVSSTLAAVSKPKALNKPKLGSLETASSGPVDGP